jgi:hypothetical protein
MPTPWCTAFLQVELEPRDTDAMAELAEESGPVTVVIILAWSVMQVLVRIPGPWVKDRP